MKGVMPRVGLVAQPEINWMVVLDYLGNIDAHEYGERVMRRSLPDAEELVEFGGRLCYRSWEEGLNPNVARVREDHDAYLENILRSGHGSVIEHANWSFVFQNVSRVFTHELVRHRAGAAYSQESLRFVRLTDIPFWFPEWAREDRELMNRSIALLHHMEDHQAWMTSHFGLEDDGVPFFEKKHKTSFMRRFAPEGVGTSILGTFNARALRHMITMRTAAGAEEEMRLVFDRVARIMRDEAPALFGDFEEQEDGSWKTPYIKV